MSHEIMVADSHAIARRGVVGILHNLLPGSQIYQAENIDEVIRLMGVHTFALIILDVAMPGGESMKLLDILFRKDKKVKVLILSDLNELLYAERYIKAGAYGFIRKSAGVAELERAIQTTLEGKRYLSSEVKDKLIKDALNLKPELNSGFSKLSDRELEVAGLLARGVAVLQIAQILHLHVGTISTYKGRIFSKLGVNSLVRLAEKLEMHRLNS